MTEDVKTTEESKEPVVEDKEVALTPTEIAAVEQGWQTKEDWEAAGKSIDEWRPAKEFKERGELFAKIETLSADLKNTRSTMAALKGHYEKVKETEFKRALQTLKQEKIAALENGEIARSVEIDDEIAEVKSTQKAQEIIQAAQPEIHPEFTQWAAANQWYSTNKEMQEFADSLGRAYAVSNPGIAPSVVLKYVTTKVKSAYPEKFTNPARTAPSATEGSPGVRKVVKSDDFQLSADEERVMNNLVKQGVLTKEKYISQIKDAYEISAKRRT